MKKNIYELCAHTHTHMQTLNTYTHTYIFIYIERGVVKDYIYIYIS